MKNKEQLTEKLTVDSVKPVPEQINGQVFDSARTARNNEFALKLKSIKEIQVLTSFKHNDSLASTGESFYDDCERWNLTSSQIEKISKSSTMIGGGEWHYRYSVLPCYYEGNAIVNGFSVSYSIHSGSYLMFSSSDTTVYFGYMGKKFRKLFLDDPMAGGE